MNNSINPETMLAQMRAMMEQAQAQTKTETDNKDAAGFSDLLKQAVNSVNSNQMHAQNVAEAFQKGEPGVQMSEVMLSLQKANVSFQAMVEVRNRLVSAYQEIMNMQV